MKYLKKFINAFVFIFALSEKARREAVDLGLVDYSGQGKNQYGK